MRRRQIWLAPGRMLQLCSEGAAWSGHGSDWCWRLGVGSKPVRVCHGIKLATPTRCTRPFSSPLLACSSLPPRYGLHLYLASLDLVQQPDQGQRQGTQVDAGADTQPSHSGFSIALACSMHWNRHVLVTAASFLHSAPGV